MGKHGLKAPKEVSHRAGKLVYLPLWGQEISSTFRKPSKQSDRVGGENHQTIESNTFIF